MAQIPVRFEFLGNLNIEKFISTTAKEFPLQLTAQYYAVKTFYDSFDWRLYQAKLLCELNQSKNSSYLSLINHETEQLVSRTAIEKIPAFVAEFEDHPLAVQLLPLLEMRALLPVVSLNLQVYHINILNKDEKTIARLTIEEYEELKHRLILEPIKGYTKAATKLSEFLVATTALKIESKPVFIRALKNIGRKPGDYSSKLNLKLAPDLPAHTAVKTIYKHLLQAIKLNEQGTINAIDTEFLHDFRVAVRRTRAGLSQLKAVLAPDVTERYKAFFAWLGEITSPTRDLDVYLLNFADYQTSLPLAMRDDLAPLQTFLKLKQIAAQRELTQQLASKKYLTSLIAWEQYLQLPIEQTAPQEQQGLSVKQLADARIWKIYRQVIKQGSAITDKSPDTALHDLRKSCKKLRYLIEFFQSLYSAIEIKTSIKNMKELQELLGDFQDCSVQEQALTHFNEEMQKNSYSEQTNTAIAQLVQVLDLKRNKARRDFADCFKLFAASENRELFKSLFANKA
jgi:CHAD domain-containing protein